MFENDIPEEINYSESFKIKKEGPPVDEDIDEELPVTESMEFKRRRNNNSPELSKVIDEVEIGNEEVSKVPDKEEFKHINKLIKGNKDELEMPRYQFTHVKTPNTITKTSQKLSELQKYENNLVLTDDEKLK